MDLSLDIEEYKLNIRAAAIIIHNGKILVHKNIKKTHYAIIGGRTEIGENSKKTVQREIMEEIGKQVDVEEYLATIENFFYVDKIKYHEIMFLYKAEFINNEDKLIETPLKNIEGKEELEYKWIELKRLDEYNLLPSAIKKILKENKYPIHIINDEINNPTE